MKLDNNINKYTYDTNISLAVSAVGILVLLLPVPSGSIYGYGTIFFSLMGLLLLNIALKTRTTIESSFMVIMKQLFSSELVPIVGLMTIIAWLFTLNIQYIDNYNSPDTLPSEFTTFKGLITWLIGISVLLVKTIVDDHKEEQYASSHNKSALQEIYKYAAQSATLLLYMMILLLSIMTGLLQVILKYYITDG
jgi:hypothetical protein